MSTYLALVQGNCVSDCARQLSTVLAVCLTRHATVRETDIGIAVAVAVTEEHRSYCPTELV